MEIFPLLQARLTLLCFLLGILSGTLFDLAYTVTEGLKKRVRLLSWILTVTFDFLIVLLVGIAVILLCFYFNNGRFRFFCLAGLAIGSSLYFFAFSKVVRVVFSRIVKVFLSILSIILTPVHKISKKIKRNLQIVLYYTVKALAKSAFWVYNIYVKMYVFKKAERGFLKQKRNDGGSYDEKNGKKIFR